MKAVITIITTLLLGMYSGTQAYAQNHAPRHPSYDVVVNNFSSNGIAVDVDYSTVVIPSRVHRREAVYVELYMAKDNKNATLGTFQIVGRHKMNAYRRAAVLGRIETVAQPDYVFASNDPQANLRFRNSFRFEEWMTGAVLYARETVAGCRNVVSESIIELAVLQHQAPPPAPVTEPAAPAEPARKIMVKEISAYFHFPVNSSVLDMSFARNKGEWNKVVEHIQKIESNENGRILTIELTGFASPEGPYNRNDKLAAERANAVTDRLLRAIELKLRPEQIITNSVAEDWDGLVRLMEKSNFAYKSQVNDIISRYGIFDGREKALMQINGGQTYKILLRDYFPQLRRTEFRITYEK